ncbi:MAG: hypothetical protein ACYSVY_28315 [Planctomycetota bacterium]|jgi:hypothetical protein
MSWTSLFKSRSSKLKPDPRVRWFGKLPTYADYYSSKTDASWAVEFNDWVIKAYQMYRTRLTGMDHKDRRLPICACVIRLPESEMTVFSSVQDYGGDMRGRPFPLCFYVAVPTAQWPGPTSDHLAAAARAVRDLTALRREVPRFLNSPGPFEAIFGEREVDLSGMDGQSQDDSWMERARKLSLADWFEGAKSGLKIKDPAAWLGYVAHWGDKLASLESKTFEPTLRLPLSAGVPSDLQMAGWLRWLESRMDLSRRSLSLMISGDLATSTGQLSVIAREVEPQDFLLMTTAAETLAYVDDLSAASLDKDASAQNGEAPLGGVPALEPSGSWADFVKTPATAP